MKKQKNKNKNKIMKRKTNRTKKIMKRTNKRNTIKRLSKKNKRKYLNRKTQRGGAERYFLYSSLTVDDVKRLAIFFQNSIVWGPIRLPNGLIDYIIKKKGTDLTTLVDTIKETMYLEKVGETYVTIFAHDKNMLSEDQTDITSALTISQTRINGLENGEPLQVAWVGDILTLGTYIAKLNEIGSIKRILKDFMTVRGGVGTVTINATILFVKHDQTDYKIILQLTDTNRMPPQKISVDLFEFSANANWVAQPEPFTAALPDKICSPLLTSRPRNSASTELWEQYLNYPERIPSVKSIRAFIKDKHGEGEDWDEHNLFTFEMYTDWENISPEKQTQLKDPRFGWRFVRISPEADQSERRAKMCRDAGPGDTMGCGGLPGLRAATGSLATQKEIERNPYNEDCNTQLCCIPGGALERGRFLYS